MGTQANQLQAGDAPLAAVRALSALRQGRRLSAEDFAAMFVDGRGLHEFVLDNAPELIYLLDREGRIRYVNQRFETLLGYRQNELLGQHYEVLVAEGFLDRARHAFQERRTGTRADPHVELKLKTRRGRSDQLTHKTGGLWVEVQGQGIYSDPNERTPENYLGACGVARDIRHRKKSTRAVNFHAFHDALTELPNRALLNDRLNLAIAQAKRSRRKLAVLFLDLNRFKRVNDHLGHSVGDRLLRATAQRVQACLRQGDTLARFGGDEFTLLLPDVRSRPAVERVAAKILQRFETPFLIDGRQLRVGASIGIALYPDAGRRSEALIENADIAMYHAKSQGGSGFAVYEEGMSRGAPRGLATSRQLRQGLRRREFIVYYQPQLCLASGRVRSVEALVRWRHPQRGLLEPDEFLPAAEELGVIADIDALVQQQAFGEAAHWRHGGAADVQVSINASAAQLDQKDFVEGFLARLGKAGLPPKAVRLEIDEYRLMQNPELVRPKLLALKEQGVRTAVDGFGAGYASLSYLQHSPIDRLNVDKSIIHDIRADGGGPGIVKAIAALAGALDMQLLAQGVVNRTQLRLLCAEGYQEAQGVLFSPPLPGDDLARLLRKNTFTDLVKQAHLPIGP